MATDFEKEIVPPNSLHTDKARQMTDGAVFHVITEGQNTMPSYAKQISVMDRWAAVRYLRVLQRAKNPTPEDLAAVAAQEAATQENDAKTPSGSDAGDGSAP